MTRLKGIDDILALTPLQQGMLFHTLYAPESSVYNIQMEFALEGELDEGALEQAWCSLVERHTALRTSFVWERVENPYQVVHHHAHLKIARHDWRALSAAEQDERRRFCLEEERTRLFDLTRPPLMRLALFVLAERKFRLVWTFHHIILEAWSAAIILGDLWKCFGDLRAHRAPDLPAVRPYAEFIRWLQRKDQSHAEAYWRERLKGFRAPVRLAIDRSIGSAPAEVKKVDSCSFTLSKNLTDALKGLARTHRVTLNTVVQGAWSILLSRYSGEQDVVFGAVLSGRPPDLPGVESIVGLFVNTLPARVNVDGDATLIPWLQALQLDQATMRQYDYSSLMQVQAWSDVPGGQPLFHTALAFQNWLGDFPSGQVTPDLQVTVLESPETSDQPLTLQVVMGDTLTLNLVFDVERFDRTAIERMLTHCRILIQGMVGNPDQRVSDLPLLTEAERRQAISGWNQAASYAKGACLHERFEKQVERTPDAVALVYEGQRLSYAELNRRANQLAHRLRELGVTPDQLVGLRIERGVEMVIGILGILKAGGAYLPLDPAYPKDRIAFMLEDSRVAVVVTQKSLTADFDDIPVARVLLDEPLPGAETNPAPVARADNLAYVIYTSGSTGKPKGALITHYNVTRLIEATDAWYHFDHQDVWTLFHSYAFDFSVWELWGALLYGGRLVVVPYLVSRSPDAFRELLIGERVTVLNQTPSAFRQLIQADLSQPKADLALRYVIFGGEALELQSLRPWFERYGDARPLLVNMYGITETTVHVTYRPIRQADLESGQGSVIGNPIPDLQIYILDPSGQPAPIGVPGEMYVGGAGVARGYLNRAELTAERFIADSFAPANGARLYRTGDLARRLENGDIEYLGRIDQQVKIRGFRVELGEIETGIAQHPAVREVVVLAREDAPGDKRLVAYVVAEDAPADLVDQLRALIRTAMPEYMVPAHFVTLDALPLTENGKVDRKALPAPSVGDVAPRAGAVAPRTATEEMVMGTFRDVLERDSFGVFDNFFDLGGHSLMAARLMSRLQAASGFSLPLRNLFERPTAAGLAQVIDGLSWLGRSKAPTNGAADREEIVL